MVYSETLSWAKCKAALRARSNVLLILQGIPGCLPWGVLSTYLNDFLAQVGHGGEGGEGAQAAACQARSGS